MTGAGTLPLLKCYTVERLLQRRRVMQQQTSSRQTIRLATALTEFCERDCSRIHDKVFALRGVTNSLIKVDYNMIASEQFIRAFIEAQVEHFVVDELSGYNRTAAKEHIELAMVLLNALGLQPSNFSTQYVLQSALRVLEYTPPQTSDILGETAWLNKHPISRSNHSLQLARQKCSHMFYLARCRAIHHSLPLVLALISPFDKDTPFATERGIFRHRNRWQRLVCVAFTEIVDGMLSSRLGSIHANAGYAGPVPDLSSLAPNIDAIADALQSSPVSMQPAGSMLLSRAALSLLIWLEDTAARGLDEFNRVVTLWTLPW